MIAKTLHNRSPLVGSKCRHCSRGLKMGEQIVEHSFGKDAPWDLRSFVAHAACVQDVIDRFGTPVTTRAAAAAEFRKITERIRAGGPVLVRA